MSSKTSFHILLNRLDADADAAALRYEELRMKIVNLLRWRGCAESHSDDLADRTLDRVAAKLVSGEQIESVGSFAAGVARFIWLEHSRKDRSDAVGDDLPEVAVDPDFETIEGPDQRIRCLRRCVATKFTDNDKILVVNYYDTDSDEKSKAARRRLADSLGLTMNALKVRACRLRSRLEACINDCIAGVTEHRGSDTHKQEVA